MNAFIQKVILGVLLVLSLSGVGEAQDPAGLVSVQASLKRLDEQLAFAKELLASFPNRQAQLYIQSAEQLRNKAREAALSNRLIPATNNVRNAQQLVDKAISMMVVVPLERLQERLQELLRHAEQVVPASVNKEADRLLRMAKNNRQQGNRAAKVGDYRKTMEYYRVATFLAERAIDVAEGPKGNLRDRLSKERERFEELLERARSAALTSKDEKSKRLLRKAERQIGSIKDAINRGDLRLALSLYYSTTRLLLRVIDIAEGRHVSERERVVEEVEALSELITVIKDRFGESADRRIAFLINRAEKLYFQAQKDVESERYMQAWQKIERARGLLERVVRGGRSEGIKLSDRAERELERLREDINLLLDRSETAQRPIVKQLLSAAKLSADDAEKWISAGRIRLALEAILAGNRMVLAAERAAKPAQSTQPDLVRKELDKLDQALSEAKSDTESQSEIALGLLRQAEEMRNRAHIAFEKGQIRLAQEYTKIALDLVMKSMQEVQ